MSVITILGIDSGMNHLGWSIHKYDTVKQVDLIVAIGQIDGNKEAAKLNRKEFKIYGNIISLYYLEEKIKLLMEEHKPDFVCCEGAFMARFPQAYASLKLCINAIQRTLYTHFKKVLYLIAPKEAKRAVAQGTADKDQVLDGIKQINHLKLSKDVSEIKDISEHESDSIAIGYAFILNTLPELLKNK